MKKILDFVNGNKTYITAVLTGITGAAEVLGYHVPEGIYLLLASAFGISIRHAIAKQDV